MSTLICRLWIAPIIVAGLLFSGSAFASNHLLDSLISDGWREKSFAGNTRYSVENNGTTTIIKGKTTGSASALFKDEQIDISSTPFMSWQWKVSNIFDNTQEQQKSGDDFPARVYVVYQKGLFKWSTVAINYVWSSQHPVGESWDSAYTSKSKIVVLQSGDASTDTWVLEKRNVRDDFKQYFGIDIINLSGYAIMVDGDNTGSEGTAWFTNIAFSKD